jgi:ribosomal protein L19
MPASGEHLNPYLCRVGLVFKKGKFSAIEDQQLTSAMEEYGSVGDSIESFIPSSHLLVSSIVLGERPDSIRNKLRNIRETQGKSAHVILESNKFVVSRFSL